MNALCHDESSGATWSPEQVEVYTQMKPTLERAMRRKAWSLSPKRTAKADAFRADLVEAAMDKINCVFPRAWETCLSSGTDADGKPVTLCAYLRTVWKNAMNECFRKRMRLGEVELPPAGELAAPPVDPLERGIQAESITLVENCCTRKEREALFGPGGERPSPLPPAGPRGRRDERRARAAGKRGAAIPAVRIPRKSTECYLVLVDDLANQPIDNLLRDDLRWLADAAHDSLPYALSFHHVASFEALELWWNDRAARGMDAMICCLCVDLLLRIKANQATRGSAGEAQDTEATLKALRMFLGRRPPLEPRPLVVCVTGGASQHLTREDCHLAFDKTALHNVIDRVRRERRERTLKEYIATDDPFMKPIRHILDGLEGRFYLEPVPPIVSAIYRETCRHRLEIRACADIPMVRVLVKRSDQHEIEDAGDDTAQNIAITEGQRNLLAAFTQAVGKDCRAVAERAAYLPPAQVRAMIREFLGEGRGCHRLTRTDAKRINDRISKALGRPEFRLLLPCSPSESGNRRPPDREAADDNMAHYTLVVWDICT